MEIAARLRREVLDRVGLPITVGVARTKFLAKVASAVAKPDGLLVVHPDHELEFLYPLPVERLWGVGAVTSAKLHDRGIRTVGELAMLDPAALVAMLGKASGHHIHALAHNRDPRRVETGRRRGSIGSQRALGSSARSFDEIDAIAAGLVDRVTGRLRKANRLGRTVVVRLRFHDFSRATRSHTLPHATAHTATILDTVLALLRTVRLLVIERGLTLVGVSVSGLEDDSTVQLALPFERRDGDALDHALDHLRARFGSAAVRRAASLHVGEGLAVPMLPD